jgi:preprotein translocase subunit SecD
MRRSLVVSLVAILVLAFGGLGLVLLAGWRPQLGLDLQGGASVVLLPEGDFQADAIGQAVEIVRNRVDGLGVAEPEVVRQGNAIVVNLPGVKNQDDALRIVGQTAQLEFRPVLASVPASAAQSTPVTTAPVPTTTPSTGVPSVDSGATTAPSSTPGLGKSRISRQTGATTTTTATTVPAAVNAAAVTTVPATVSAAAVTTVPSTASPSTTVPSTGETTLPTCLDASDFDQPDQTVVLPECQKREVVTYYQLGPTFLTGDGVESAQAVFSQQSGWTVELVLKPGAAGIDTFNEWAAKCYNGTPECPSSGASRGRVAIVLDGIVKSAPQINAPSFSRDQITISGNFSEKEAKELALVLRYGALPVKLVPQAVQTVSATLGANSLQAGVIAGAIGIALVMVLMLLYYRRLAVVVLAGLCVSLALIFTVICVLGETRGLALTLAGATGLIVSIGVTVDSYVVYFERLKDDVRGGRTIRNGAERGFKSAWRTILAADIVSLIAAGLLWWLTVGSVRGFAFFLGLSTLVDMVVAYFFTRPAVVLLSRTDFLAGSKVLGVTTGEGVATGGPR